MPKLSLSKVAGLLPTLVLALVAVGCSTKETIVYTDPVPFNPPADAASGFVGYYTPSQKQTTCGNCHADFQAEWSETRHASAYKSLKDLPAGSTQPFCYSCHDVTNKGNAKVPAPAGYDKVQDSSYYDVQCESCHGPGQKHIESVNAGSVIKPLAQFGVGVRMVDDHGTEHLEVTADTLSGCGACHSDIHNPFLEQWAESRHALVRVGYAGRPGCGNRCHEGRGAVQSWGAEPAWKEGPWTADPATPTGAGQIPLVCSVCHDPHGGPNPYQLRYPINSPDETVNLCIKCHLNRATPAPPSSVAPHGSQGGVLLGFAGYRPPNFAYDTARIYGSHASPSANAELCAGCHVQRQTINDASGKFQFQSVGHLFKPIPCLDAKGNPTGDDSCAFTATARSWNACTKSGCHATTSVAANAFIATRAEVQTLVNFLWRNTGGISCGGGTGPCLDPAPTDQGYLPTLKKALPALWTGPELSAAEGCEFNARLTGEGLTGHPDGSKGAHNPFLYRALLNFCISYLKEQYPLILPAPPADIQAIMDRWDAPVLGRAPVIARVPLPAFDH